MTLLLFVGGVGVKQNKKDMEQMQQILTHYVQDQVGKNAYYDKYLNDHNNDFKTHLGFHNNHVEAAQTLRKRVDEHDKRINAALESGRTLRGDSQTQTQQTQQEDFLIGPSDPSELSGTVHGLSNMAQRARFFSRY